MSDVFSQRNLPDRAEGWGREVEDRIKALETGVSRATSVAKGAQVVSVKSAEAADENIRQVAESVAVLDDAVTQRIQDTLDLAVAELRESEKVLEAQFAAHDAAIASAEAVISEVGSKPKITISEDRPPNMWVGNPGDIWYVFDGERVEEMFSLFVSADLDSNTPASFQPLFFEGGGTIENINAGTITSGTINTARLDANEVAAAVGVFIDAMMENLTVTGVAAITQATVDNLYARMAVVEKLQATQGIITKDMIATGAITTSKLMIGVAGNLIPNGAGEMGGPGAWSKGLAWDTTDKPDGYAGSVLVVPQGATTVASDWTNLEVVEFDVEPSTEYLLELWAKADAPGCNIWGRVFNQAGTHGGNMYQIPGIPALAGDGWASIGFNVPTVWTRFAAIYKTKADTERLHLKSFWTHADHSPSPGNVRVAGVRLQKRTRGELIVDGSISAAMVDVGQNAKWDSTGLRFFTPVAQGQQWDDWDSRQPLIELTPGGSSAVRVSDGMSVTAGLDPTGLVWGETGDFGNLKVAGRDFLEYVEDRPLGTLGITRVKNNLPVNNTENHFAGVRANLYHGRSYMIQRWFGVSRSSGEVQFRTYLKWGTNNVRIAQQAQGVNGDFTTPVVFQPQEFGVPNGQEVLVMQSIMTTTTGATGTLWADMTNKAGGAQMALFDMGPATTIWEQTVSAPVNPVVTRTDAFGTSGGQPIRPNGSLAPDGRLTTAGYSVYGSDMSEYVYFPMSVPQLNGSTVNSAVAEVQVSYSYVNSWGTQYFIGVRKGGVDTNIASGTAYAGQVNSITFPAGHRQLLVGAQGMFLKPYQSGSPNSYGNWTGHFRVTVNYSK